jgi:hypothetical protein
MLITVQLGTVFYARAVASSAARQGLDAGRVADGTAARGEAASRQFLTHVHAGLRDPAIEVDRGPADITVTVSSEVVSLVPLWRPTVTVTVVAPVEEVTSS